MCLCQQQPVFALYLKHQKEVSHLRSAIIFRLVPSSKEPHSVSLGYNNFRSAFFSCIFYMAIIDSEEDKLIVLLVHAELRISETICLSFFVEQILCWGNFLLYFNR